MDPARDLNAAGAKPMPHFPPIVENRAARRTQSRLRVVLLNAAGGRRFREIARCLKRPPLCDADVILLCEVNSRPRGRAVALELARLLDMSCAYIPEYGLKRPGGEIFSYLGNAILSSVPFEDVTAVAMHRPRTPSRQDAVVTRRQSDGIGHQREIRRRRDNGRRHASAQSMRSGRARAPDGDLPRIVPGVGSRDLWRRSQHYDQRAVEPRADMGDGAGDDRGPGQIPHAPGLRAAVRASARAPTHDRRRQRGQSLDVHFFRTDTASVAAEA